MATEGSGVGAAQADASKALNLSQRFERLPISRWHHKIFLIVATAWLFDSIDLASLTFVLAPISTEFGLSGGQAGLLASASFAGMFVGATTAGMLADRFGRKVVFQTSMIVWGSASLALAFSWNWESLMAFRFLLGLGMGAEFPMGQALVSEFMPSKKRGQYTGFLEGFWPIGFITAGALSLVMVPTLGWRSIFILQGILAIWVLIIRRFVPESPRWYESRGLFDDADETMRGIETQVEGHIGSLPEPEPPRYAERVFTGFSFLELFRPGYRGRTIMIWAAWFFILLGYYGITTWVSKLLADQGYEVAASIGYVLLFSLWGIPGFLSASLLLERIGRKLVLSIYVIMSAVAAFLYGQAPALDSLFWLIVAGSFMQFWFFGMWSALYAYTPEIFPTRARGVGGGSSSSMGRLGALLGPALVPVVLASYGNSGVFIMGAAAFVIAAAVVLIFGPETKGRVLEEVST
jgi:putative MFS transporter